MFLYFFFKIKTKDYFLYNGLFILYKIKILEILIIMMNVFYSKLKMCKFPNKHYINLVLFTFVLKENFSIQLKFKSLSNK